MQKNEFYESPRWLRVRKRVLLRDKYQDIWAKRYGKVKAAEVVHHIFPRDEFPQYQYSTWNLISVSRQTHNTFHDRDTDELTETGMELLRSTARKNGIEIPEKYMVRKGKGRSKRRDAYYT